MDDMMNSPTIRQRIHVLKTSADDPIQATFDCAAINLFGCLVDDLTPEQEAELNALSHDRISELSAEIVPLLGANPTTRPK